MVWSIPHAICFNISYCLYFSFNYLQMFIDLSVPDTP